MATAEYNFSNSGAVLQGTTDSAGKVVYTVIIDGIPSQPIKWDGNGLVTSVFTSTDRKTFGLSIENQNVFSSSNPADLSLFRTIASEFSTGAQSIQNAINKEVQTVADASDPGFAAAPAVIDPNLVVGKPETVALVDYLRNTLRVTNQQTVNLTEAPLVNSDIEAGYAAAQGRTINNPDAPDPGPIEGLPPSGIASNPGPAPNAKGATGIVKDTQAKATSDDNSNINATKDWRVKLTLAPGSKYLYNDPQAPGILQPLKNKGIIFPYTPQIQIQYAAHYDPTEIAHSNYKIFQYKGSSVDNITITCQFTAQDTYEANYLLAVIHFLRSATKMFYGKDQDPIAGTPPPLCYLTGLGAFQFDQHPLAITGFNYSLPDDVDYIRASITAGLPAGSNTSGNNSVKDSSDASANRQQASGLQPGAASTPPDFKKNQPSSTGSTTDPTYVPTKIQIQVAAIPIVSRNDISNTFSLKDYATGKLLRGSTNAGKGGIW